MRLAEPLLQRVLKRQFASQCATLKHVLEEPPAPSPAGDIDARPVAKGTS